MKAAIILGLLAGPLAAWVPAAAQSASEDAVSAARGSAVRGSAVRGSAVRGSAVRGSASVVLLVEGMRCAQCSLRVRNALKALDGVSAVRAEGDDKRAITVDYDPARVGPQAMVDAVEKAGYHAHVR